MDLHDPTLIYAFIGAYLGVVGGLWADDFDDLTGYAGLAAAIHAADNGEETLG